MNKNTVAKQAVDWKQTTITEIKSLFVMTIILNDLLIVPNDKRYFFSGGNTSVFHTLGIRNIFSLHKRYFDLRHYTSSVNPDHEKTEDEARDMLYKIEMFLAQQLQICLTSTTARIVFQLMKEWCPFKGRLKIKVCMPDKSVKYGIKLFMLCDSTNGYCKRFDFYVGSDERNVGNLGKTCKTVLNLLQGLEYTHPVLSKVPEKLVAQQIVHYVELNQSLKQTISGFRKGHSTTTVLLRIRDDIIRAMKKGELTLMVLADYSKAFDTVSYSVIIQKMWNMGFSKHFLVQSALLGWFGG